MPRLLPIVLLAASSSLPAGGEPLSAPAAWLREYVQIDTTNPPGPPEEAIVFLEGLLEHPAIEVERFVHPDGWTTLAARLPANRPPGGEALVLLHHIDVVPAEGTWTHPPFSGRIEDGRLWGRGSIDVKSLGIAQVAAVLDLASSGTERSRDVLLLATPDEETGGRFGVGWLWDAHPELFDDVSGVVNEGGSNRVVRDRLLWWGVEVAQKRPLWLRLTVRGRGGHGSTLRPESATHRLVLALARLVERPFEWRVEEATREYLTAVSRLEGRPGGLADRLDSVILPDGPTEPLAPGLPTLFLDTVQVTRLDNGRGTNVIAPEARAWIDCRLLPGTDARRFLDGIAESLGPEVEIEVLLDAPIAPPSETDTRLWSVLEEVLGLRGPVVPMMISGATDSRWFRERGVPAYGLAPFAVDAGELRGIHGPDESLPLVDFERGTEVMRRLVREWVAGESDSAL